MMAGVWLLQAAPGEANAAALALCLAMAIGLIFYVFYLPEEVAAAPVKTRLAFLQERKEAVYENLRDLNFEHKAGKIPESDFQEMRNSLEEEAAALLAEIEALENGATGSQKGKLPSRV
jgi:hypothetical protein